MHPPLISILVPSFNHPEGIRRMFASLGTQVPRPEVEILVSDDSTDDGAAASIEAQCAHDGQAVYWRNRPPLGAVVNWNRLLERASGSYCLLLHHDECFAHPSVLDAVLRLLRSAPDVDGVVFPCRAVSHTVPSGLLHMPRWLAQWVVRWLPGYLLRRNVLGPPSVLVLRRSHYERFDERLRWLVDTELYTRVIARHRPRWVFFEGDGLVSDGTGHQSITATLKGQTTNLRRREISLLEQDGALERCHGAWMMSSSPLAALVRAVEAVLWLGFRAVQRVGQQFLRPR